MLYTRTLARLVVRRLLIGFLGKVFLAIWSRDIKDLALWRTDVFRREGLCNRDLKSRQGSWLVFSVEDGIKIGEERGEYWSVNVKGRREDDADVANTHFVDIAVVDNANEKFRKGPNKGPVCWRKFSH